MTQLIAKTDSVPAESKHLFSTLKPYPITFAGKRGNVPVIKADNDNRCIITINGPDQHYLNGGKWTVSEVCE